MANLTAKILCRHHNNRLSPVDAAGKHTCETLDRCVALGSRRAADPNRAWSYDCFPVDGPLFERWLTKTAINLLVARDLSVADGAIALEPVPQQLVRFAFGVEDLPMPTGLYVAYQPNEVIGPRETMTIDLIANPRVGIIAVLYCLQGFRFLLWLGVQPPANPLDLPGARDPTWQRSHIYRHLGQLQWYVHQKASHFIDFAWPERPRTNLKLFV